MFRRYAHLWAGLAALGTYAGAYLFAWSVVWDVPAVERDGLEWMFVFPLTLPWSLLAGIGGWIIVHAGALINGVLLAVVVSREVNRRWPSGRHALIAVHSPGGVDRALAAEGTCRIVWVPVGLDAGGADGRPRSRSVGSGARQLIGRAVNTLG